VFLVVDLTVGLSLEMCHLKCRRRIEWRTIVNPSAIPHRYILQNYLRSENPLERLAHGLAKTFCFDTGNNLSALSSFF
jgi:hypothetical protein